MILDSSPPESLLQNCLPPAASEKVGRCGRAVLVVRRVFARLPRNESFTLITRLDHLSITQQAPESIKSRSRSSWLSSWLMSCAAKHQWAHRHGQGAPTAAGDGPAGCTARLLETAMGLSTVGSRCQV